MAMVKKQLSRIARKGRIRKNIEGSLERPRLSVFKSARYIYAQIVNDTDMKTLVSCSSAEKSFAGKLKSTRDVNAAKEVGKTLAQRAKDKKINTVVFDRNGYVYHGRVRALADGAREAGLQF